MRGYMFVYMYMHYRCTHMCAHACGSLKSISGVLFIFHLIFQGCYISYFAGVRAQQGKCVYI